MTALQPVPTNEPVAGSRVARPTTRPNPPRHRAGTRPDARRRANRVAERPAAAVALLAGAVAASAGVAPTGRPGVDALLAGLGVAAVTWSAASAPWWALTLTAGLGMVVSASPALLAVGGAALATSLWIGVRKRNAPTWRAVAIGLALNVIVRGELPGFFGLTAIVGVTAAALVLIVGVRRRPRRVRRVVWLAAGGVLLFAVLAGASFGLAASRARSDLTEGRDQTEAGLDLLRDGDIVEAADRFAAASALFARGERRLTGPWTWAATVVPVVSQHRDAVAGLSSAGADVTAHAAAALGAVDTGGLGLQAGEVDIALVAALSRPLAEVDAALADLSTVLEESRSPWLLAPLDHELRSLDEQIAELRPGLTEARAAVALAPEMLGASGRRTYLVLFTTPAESRGLGGFPGNYAEITADGGRIDMVAFGRVAALESRAEEIDVQIDAPAEFLSNYGNFGYRPDGLRPIGTGIIRNLTMTPNFPWVGETAASLYEQIAGTHVDGVIAMDPFVLQALLQYVGPVQLESLPTALTTDNAADYLLREQYAIAEDTQTRVDAIEEAAEKAFGMLLESPLPDPATLVRDLGPLAAERRLMVWTREPAEQDMLRRFGLLGEIPHHDGADGWSFAVNNAGGSKIDSFLERTAHYESTTSPTLGTTTGTLRIDLTNTAPADGLPDYLIGNARGLPNGTSRLYVEFYSPMLLVSSSRDGRALSVTSGTERGWNVYGQYLDIPPGATTSLTFVVNGHLERPDELVTWVQPLANPLRISD